MAKRAGKKQIDKKIWSDNDCSVKGGRIVRRGSGKVSIGQLFKAVGEKLPYQAINKVENYVIHTLGIKANGIYLAHDSMGCPRYIGRGAIFNRLKSHKKNHSKELYYFSFYIVSAKQHEREIETLVLRSSSYLAVFNERKIRASIEPGNMLDYEVGTQFIERQWKRGPRAR